MYIYLHKYIHTHMRLQDNIWGHLLLDCCWISAAYRSMSQVVQRYDVCMYVHMCA